MVERVKTIAVIDGNHLAFRAHCVLHLSDSKGRNTSTIYGVTEMLSNLVREYIPDALVVVWDGGKSQNRRNILPTYKASRAPKTEEERKGKEEFYTQLIEVKHILDYLGVPQIEIEGYEGDDLLCAVTKLAHKRGYISLIVTSDKDMLQLVAPDVFWLDPIRKRLVSQENFYAQMGMAKDDFLLFKCLQGDAGDDVPGIRGIGETYAKKLLQKYHSIDDLVSNAGTERPEKLVKGQREILERNMKLVDLQQFVTDEILVKAETMMSSFRPIEANRLIEIFNDYEMKSLSNELPELIALYNELRGKNEEFIKRGNA